MVDSHGGLAQAALLASLLLPVGCGGGADVPGGSGGAGVESGTGGVLGTGGAPAPTPRGAAHYRVWDCASMYGGDHADGAPVPDIPLPGSATPGGHPGNLIEDGAPSDSGAGYEVSCTVSGTATLTVEAQLSGPNHSPLATEPETATRISLSASIEAATGQGVGEVKFSVSDATDVSPGSQTHCQFSATPEPLHACSDAGCTNGRQANDTGHVWIQFTCPTARVGAGLTGCQSSGTIVLEGCATR